MKKRVELFDLLKGWAIFLVIYGHIIYLYDTNSSQNPMLMFIYMFHMPLFIAISGYFIHPSQDRHTLKDWAKKKFLTILLPSITYGVVISMKIGAGMVVRHDIDCRILIKNFIHGLWFLPVLFILCVFSKIVSMISSKHETIIWSIFILGIQFLPRDILFNGLKALSIFFYLGIIANKYQQRIVEIYKSNTTTINICVLLFMIICYYSFDFNTTLYKIKTNIFQLEYWESFFIRTLSGILGIAFSTILCNYIAISTSPLLKKIKQYLLYMGNISLELYATHLYIYYFVLVYIPYRTSNIIESLIYAVILAYISIIIYRTVCKKQLFNKIFYGK